MENRTVIIYGDELYHHGVKGQRWGIRRYQNPDGSLTEAGKRRYLAEVHEDMEREFYRNISSKEARKVSRIGKNGYDQRGMDWNEAYRHGKVTAKDDLEVRRASRRAREYVENKYGKDTLKALQKSGLFYKPKSDFTPTQINEGKSMAKFLMENKLKRAYEDLEQKQIDRIKDQNSRPNI